MQGEKTNNSNDDNNNFKQQDMQTLKRVSSISFHLFVH